MRLLISVSLVLVSALELCATEYQPMALAPGRAYALNNPGQVVGTSLDSPFIWQNGNFHRLNYGQRAEAINDSGTLVGCDGSFISDGTTIQPLPVSCAVDINIHGVVTGEGNGAFRYDSGNIVTIVGGNAAGLGINDAGHIVGYGNFDFLGRRPFLYVEGGVQPLLSPEGSVAEAINNHDQVVGTGFLWQNGNITSLNGLHARDINDLGQIVGDGGFIWENGIMTDLNNLLVPGSNLVIDGAYGINELGQIAGYGHYINGPDGDQAILLNPTPEPSSFSLLTLSVILLTRKRRK